jgi:hypothetical protein
MLYKRKIINNTKWWRIRKTIGRNCMACVESPFYCADHRVNIFSDNGDFTIIGLGFACRTLERQYYYDEEERNL